MKKFVTGIVTGLALLALAGCGSNNKKSSSSTNDTNTQKRLKNTGYPLTLDKNKIKANNQNSYSITGKTNSDVALYLLSSKGKNIDTITSEKSGKFKFSESGPETSTTYYVTTDPDTSIEKKGNDLKKLHHIKSFIVTPNSAFAQSQKAAEESSKAISRASSRTESISISAEVSSEMASESSSSKASSTKKTYGPHYKKVSLEDFATDPYKYEGKNIETSGHVTYIQKNPDNENVYFVVILPKDDYSSSGYSYGSVTEIDVDTMHETPVHEGDNITVRGGAMTSTVKLNGKTLKTDITVDSVTVH